ncbi:MULTISPECIES: DUF4386 family protein [Pseudoalteromonas]|uniref:DUF4386 family protein n=1 Tax=Pseudoalteromonas maricaloris TaxID=184924 RepID=A0A8I2H1Z4_9GAMM|nr:MULTISPECIES: DUF4386 family protein [Pseudoalteromonas]NLR20860.1 DUF4386 family protein [Pseudoalteromonas maricaloris]RZG12152.1 DUF4386 family protein [Pseudoalteromonas sp. CO342X]WOX30901.1 DUF4386 family protein [Pseudoalteromonas maricaloris]
MSLQKWGGVAALTEAATYLFGFVLFFGVLDSSEHNTPTLYLDFFVQNRDTFFLGYIVIGIIFSFALIVLVQAIHQRFHTMSPDCMKFASVVGYIWAAIVLASTMVFLTSIEAIAKFHEMDPALALTINRTVSIVVDALGGGIELVGAIWVLTISCVGLKHKIFSPLLHYWGLLVSLAGILTLFSGLSFLAKNPFFEVTTAIFGLGQILWFIGIGVMLLRNKTSSVVAPD